MPKISLWSSCRNALNNFDISVLVKTLACPTRLTLGTLLLDDLGHIPPNYQAFVSTPAQMPGEMLLGQAFQRLQELDDLARSARLLWVLVVGCWW
jgi:hypothetical protein